MLLTSARGGAPAPSLTIQSLGAELGPRGAREWEVPWEAGSVGRWTSAASGDAPGKRVLTASKGNALILKGLVRQTKDH